MSEPTTQASGALLDEARAWQVRTTPPVPVNRAWLRERLAAIEAEARAQGKLHEMLAQEGEALPHDHDAGAWCARCVEHGIVEEINRSKVYDAEPEAEVREAVGLIPSPETYGGEMFNIGYRAALAEREALDGALRERNERTAELLQLRTQSLERREAEVERLRTALDEIAYPPLNVTDECPFCGTDDDGHGEGCATTIARAALAETPEENR